MTTQTIIRKTFITRLGKKTDITIESNDYSFRLKIDIQNEMICDTKIFTRLMQGDEIEPHIEDLDTINIVNEKLIELQGYITNMYTKK